MAEEEDGKEGGFFSEQPREDSTVGHVGPPPSRWPKLVAGGALGLVIIALAFWQLRPSPQGTLWVMNPGPKKVNVTIGDGEAAELRPGRLIDQTLKLDGPITVQIDRDGKVETESFNLKSNAQSVTLFDLGGEAAYVVLNVSAHYGDAAEPELFPLTFLSEKGRVHEIPLPANKLLRPGQPLPDKGSWELNAFKLSGTALEVHKAFRVDAKRTEARDELIKILSEGVRGGRAADFENTRLVVTSTQPRGSFIPSGED